MTSKIAFVGLGQMGYHMASNLLKNSQTTTFAVLDALPKTLTSFTKSHPKSSTFSKADTANIVFTMLPESKHVRAVYDELLTRPFAPGTIFVDCSTIDPNTSKDIAKRVEKIGCIMFDAPVSGGTPGAQAGTLTFMVGGKSNDDFKLVTPYLEKMGKNVVYCGANGNGLVAKIANNMLLGISMVR